MDRKLGHSKSTREKDRLYAFEMWTWCNMGNISLKDQNTTEYVLGLVKEKIKLLNTVLETKKAMSWTHLERSCERTNWKTDGREDEYHISCY